jgi:ankyrin repeat protein
MPLEKNLKRVLMMLAQYQKKQAQKFQGLIPMHSQERKPLGDLEITNDLSQKASQCKELNELIERIESVIIYSREAKETALQEDIVKLDNAIIVLEAEKKKLMEQLQTELCTLEEPSGLEYIVPHSYQHILSIESPIGLSTSVNPLQTKTDYHFIVVIPYYSREKDKENGKSIQDIIARFSNEAFETSSSIGWKLSLVIGINEEISEQSVDPFTLVGNLTSPFAVEICSFHWKRLSKDHPRPMGAVRNFINASPEVRKLILGARRYLNVKQIYYAIFDADTEALNTCFSHYERAIRQHIIQYHKPPHILTSGYITNTDDNQNKATSMFNLGTKLDHSMRQCTSKYLPFFSYITEANVLILLPDTDDCLQEQFSVGLSEMEGMRREIVLRRKINPKKDIIFVENAPIQTAYRENKLKEIQFRGYYEHGKYIHWHSKDLQKLKMVWQTHYCKNARLWKTRLDKLLQITNDYLHHKQAYDRLGNYVTCAVRKFFSCFDPLAITDLQFQADYPIFCYDVDNKKEYPENIRLNADYLFWLIEIDKNSTARSKAYVETLRNVIKNYFDYVGDKSKKYKLSRSVYGGQSKLTFKNSKADPVIAILNNAQHAGDIFKILQWVLVVFLFCSERGLELYEQNEEIFFKITYREESLYESFVREKHGEPKPKPTKDITLTNYQVLIHLLQSRFIDVTNDLEIQVEAIANDFMQAFYETGLQIRGIFEQTLEMNEDKFIPSFLEQVIDDNVPKRKNNSSPDYQPCHIAIFDGDVNTIASFDISTLKKYGRFWFTTLHMLAISSRTDLLKMHLDQIVLLPEKERKQIVEAEAWGKITPVKLAFQVEKEQHVALLIAAGATYDDLLKSSTHHQGNLLHILSQYSDFYTIAHVLNHLREHPVHINNLIKTVSDFKNEGDYLMQTPLHCFLSQGRREIDILALLVTPENVNAEDDDGFTPLLLASQHENMHEVCMFLISNGAECAYQSEPAEQSSFEQAIEDNDYPLAQQMLKNGFDLTDLPFIFHEAICQPGSYLLLNLLISHLNPTQLHTTLNRLDHQGHAPIHLAVIFKRTHLLELLIAHGANPFLSTQRGLTPLVLAGRKKNYDAVYIFRFVELEKIITIYVKNAPKVRYGQHAGELPRNLREIDNALKNIKNNQCAIAQGLNSIIQIAKNMGTQHPILIAVRRCLGALTNLKNSQANSFDEPTHESSKIIFSDDDSDEGSYVRRSDSLQAGLYRDYQLVRKTFECFNQIEPRKEMPKKGCPTSDPSRENESLPNILEAPLAIPNPTKKSVFEDLLYLILSHLSADDLRNTSLVAIQWYETSWQVFRHLGYLPKYLTFFPVKSQIFPTQRPNIRYQFYQEQAGAAAIFDVFSQDLSVNKYYFEAMAEALRELGSLTLPEYEAGDNDIRAYLKTTLDNDEHVIVAHERWALDISDFKEKKLYFMSTNFPYEEFLYFLILKPTACFVLPINIKGTHYVGLMMRIKESKSEDESISLHFTCRYTNPTSRAREEKGKDKQVFEAIKHIFHVLEKEILPALDTVDAEGKLNDPQGGTYSIEIPTGSELKRFQFLASPVSVSHEIKNHSCYQQHSSVDCGFIVAQSLVDIVKDVAFTIPSFDEKPVQCIKMIAQTRATFCPNEAAIKSQYFLRLAKALVENPAYYQLLRHWLLAYDIAILETSSSYYAFLWCLKTVVQHCERGKEGFQGMPGNNPVDQARNFMQADVYINSLSFLELKNYTDELITPHFEEHGGVIFRLNPSLTRNPPSLGYRSTVS